MKQDVVRLMEQKGIDCNFDGCSYIFRAYGYSKVYDSVAMMSFYVNDVSTDVIVKYADSDTSEIGGCIIMEYRTAEEVVAMMMDMAEDISIVDGWEHLDIKWA